MLRHPNKRAEAERTQLIQVQQADPLLATLVTHTEAFAQMVRERAAERLEPWLEVVLASPWCELKRFAQGLRQDYAASNNSSPSLIVILTPTGCMMPGRVPLSCG